MNQDSFHRTQRTRKSSSVAQDNVRVFIFVGSLLVLRKGSIPTLQHKSEPTMVSATQRNTLVVRHFILGIFTVAKKYFCLASSVFLTCKQLLLSISRGLHLFNLK